MTNATVRSVRPGLAAVFSAVIPGSGQWHGGRLRRALLVFAPVVLLAALASAAWSLRPVRLLELAVQPKVLWALLILDFCDIVTVGFIPPDYAPTENHRNQPIPDLAAIRAKVQEILDRGTDTVFETGRDTECRV